ncbi:MAG: sodium:solute symporter [Eubacteriales bacterium]|nr:sodium:solute symporter [Eubacteriales bacterium]
MTQLIATISLAVFVIVMLIVGVYSTKKAGTVEGFLLGGRGIGPWLSAFAYGTTYFSAVIFIGYAGMFGWTIGMGSMWIGFGNAIIGCLLAWIFLAKRTRRMTRTLNSRTMPEFFAARYNSRRMKLYSAVIIFIFLVPYAAGVYKGLGTMFSAIFVGADPVICMFIVAALTGIYLVLGGYVATATNDFIQGLIMIFGIVAMVLILVSRPEVGGFASAFEKLSAIDPKLTDITGGDSRNFLITNIVLTSFGVWGLPQMVHKYYAIKNEKDIKIGTTVSTLFAILIGCGAYFTGSLSRLFLDADDKGLPNVAGGFDNVVPSVLMRALTESIFSTIVLSVILLLLLSASMSTLSSIVLSSSSAVSVDMVREVRPQIKPKNQVILMRVLCLVFIALSYIFATANISFIVNLMSFSWGVVAGSFIGPFLWGLYSKKITKTGAWAGMLAGIVVVGTMLTYYTVTAGFEAAKSMAPVFGVSAMAVSFVIVPLVSLFTKKFSEEHNTKVFEIIE